MKSTCLIVVTCLAILTAGCSRHEPTLGSIDDTIPKITIVAKRLTEEQKRDYDDEMLRAKIDLAQR